MRDIRSPNTELHVQCSPFEPGRIPATHLKYDGVIWGSGAPWKKWAGGCTVFLLQMDWGFGVGRGAVNGLLVGNRRQRMMSRKSLLVGRRLLEVNAVQHFVLLFTLSPTSF